MKIKVENYIIPHWAYAALVNSDESGLSEAECEALDAFITLLPASLYKVPLGGAEEVGLVGWNAVTDWTLDMCVYASFQVIEE